MEFFHKAKDAAYCKKDDFFRIFSERGNLDFWVKSAQKETLLTAKE